MNQQIERLSSIRAGIQNAQNFQLQDEYTRRVTEPLVAEYNAIKMNLMLSAEGVREWEKYCNRNGFYHTHTATDFFDGKTPAIRI